MDRHTTVYWVEGRNTNEQSGIQTDGHTCIDIDKYIDGWMNDRHTNKQNDIPTD